MSPSQRPHKGVVVDVDDAAAAVVEFENGAIGTIEASRVASGYVNESRIQVDGSKASITFDVQNLNHLRFGSSARATISLQGSPPRSTQCSPAGGHQAPGLPGSRPEKESLGVR